MGLKRELHSEARISHFSHSINKNTTGMVLPLTASCRAEETRRLA